MPTETKAARRRRLSQESEGMAPQVMQQGTGSILPMELAQLYQPKPQYYMELTVSPGFDAEIPAGMPQKECQDDACIIRNFANNPNQVFLGVFDGHGSKGLMSSRFSVQHLPQQIASNPQYAINPQLAFLQACRAVGHSLNSGECGFDCMYSGTTACFAVLKAAPEGNVLLLGNVGDSRAVVARGQPDGSILGMDLTADDKPTDAPEKARIEAMGGHVGQQEYDPGEFDGPFRVFVKGKKVPGLAMSRSLGDGLAESVGVIPDPTCSQYVVHPNDKFVLFATDGLWEVFTSEESVQWAAAYMADASAVSRMPVTQAIAEEAQRRWTRIEDCVVDDTSVLVVRFRL